MKILYFSPHPYLNISSSTGYGRHMREMVSAFKKNGHEVKTLIIGGEDVVSNSPKPTSGTKAILKKLTPPVLWETLKDFQLISLDKKVAIQLQNVVDDFKPDVIYERGYYLMPSGAIVAKEKNIKHVLEINAPYIEERIELQGKSMLLNNAYVAEKNQIEKTDLLVVVSSPLKEYFVKKHPAFASKILVTPNAVNPADVLLDSNKADAIKTNLGLKDKTVIGFVGSIFPYHGVDILIEAFDRVIKEIKNTNAVLLIIGDGETLPQLKSLVLEKKIENSVIFTGKIPHKDIYNYIQVFDIAIMAKTNWYCSPVKIFEYGILKKPIIAPDTQSVKDVITPNEDGLLVSPVAQSIAGAMKLYLKDIELRNRHGNSFYEKIKLFHTWDKVAKDVIDNLK